MVYYRVGRKIPARGLSGGIKLIKKSPYGGFFYSYRNPIVKAYLNEGGLEFMLKRKALMGVGGDSLLR